MIWMTWRLWVSSWRWHGRRRHVPGLRLGLSIYALAITSAARQNNQLDTSAMSSSPASGTHSRFNLDSSMTNVFTWAMHACACPSLAKRWVACDQTRCTLHVLPSMRLFAICKHQCKENVLLNGTNALYWAHRCALVCQRSFPPLDEKRAHARWTGSCCDFSLLKVKECLAVISSTKGTRSLQGLSCELPRTMGHLNFLL